MSGDTFNLPFDLLDDRRPGESPSSHMIRGMFASIESMFSEAGVPLSSDQKRLLFDAYVKSLS